MVQGEARLHACVRVGDNTNRQGPGGKFVAGYVEMCALYGTSLYNMSACNFMIA